MKISWVILTYNRANSVCKAIPHSMAKAGMKWDEIIWVDNGSSPEDRHAINEVMGLADNVTKVLLPENLGVAKGYNRGMALANGTHIVITGCDMLMPPNWLKSMAECFDIIPKTGIVTIYAAPISKTPERIRGPEEVVSGIKIRPAMPIGRRMLTKDLQRKIGYFNEGFGLYGWDDVAWGHTAERVCDELGLRYYNLVDKVAEHLGTEGNVGYDHKDEHEYWKWKKREVEDPKKRELMNKLSKDNYPTFTPF